MRAAARPLLLLLPQLLPPPRLRHPLRSDACPSRRANCHPSRNPNSTACSPTSASASQRPIENGDCYPLSAMAGFEISRHDARMPNTGTTATVRELRENAISILTGDDAIDGITATTFRAGEKFMLCTSSAIPRRQRRGRRRRRRWQRRRRRRQRRRRWRWRAQSPPHAQDHRQARARGQGW